MSKASQKEVELPRFIATLCLSLEIQYLFDSDL